MELENYGLDPQQQLAVSLYLKCMNKTQAAQDAGYSSPSVFNHPLVKKAIAEQLSIRAERLRIGADWVLMQAVNVFDRCMQNEPVFDKDGEPTGKYKFDASNAIKALSLVGKHVDVKAFQPESRELTGQQDKILERLQRGRQRLATKNEDVSFL
jgi:phage terminase small subunit